MEIKLCLLTRRRSQLVQLSPCSTDQIKSIKSCDWWHDTSLWSSEYFTPFWLYPFLQSKSQNPMLPSILTNGDVIPLAEMVDEDEVEGGDEEDEDLVNTAAVHTVGNCDTMHERAAEHIWTIWDLADSLEYQLQFNDQWQLSVKGLHSWGLQRAAWAAKGAWIWWGDQCQWHGSKRRWVQCSAEHGLHVLMWTHCWNGISWDVILTWNWTFRQGIVSDHCAVKTCANDIILTADW